MRRFAMIASLATLAACGFNGTDPDKDEQQAAAPQASPAPADPDLADLETEDIPDSEARPQMQLQIVLDQRGFGPGVIDGKEGLSTANALKGFQEASSLAVTGKLDEATRTALAQWEGVPATRVVRIPASWGEIDYAPVPDEPEDQARMERLGYESLDEKLAERFHTTVDVLEQLNPDGRPAGSAEATPATATPTPPPSSATSPGPQPKFRAGQLVRVPNVGLDPVEEAAGGDEDWQRTLRSLGIDGDQPEVARVVVDKSEGWLKGYDKDDRLVAMFTVTSGSSHDPLPLGDWKVLGVSKNPSFHYNPDLFWDADASDEKETLPPGPNGPVGVVWIDLSKEHYGIHGTGEPQTIGRAQSHGCVRLTNWDVARLAEMVSVSTKVTFQA
jgi:lipoprotein-anchoring transpeptidase ErfK/SrfK